MERAIILGVASKDTLELLEKLYADPALKSRIGIVLTEDITDEFPFDPSRMLNISENIARYNIKNRISFENVEIKDKKLNYSLKVFENNVLKIRNFLTTFIDDFIDIDSGSETLYYLKVFFVIDAAAPSAFGFRKIFLDLKNHIEKEYPQYEIFFNIVLLSLSDTEYNYLNVKSFIESASQTDRITNHATIYLIENLNEKDVKESRDVRIEQVHTWFLEFLKGKFVEYEQIETPYKYYRTGIVQENQQTIPSSRQTRPSEENSLTRKIPKFFNTMSFGILFNKIPRKDLKDYIRLILFEKVTNEGIDKEDQIYEEFNKISGNPVILNVRMGNDGKLYFTNSFVNLSNYYENFYPFGSKFGFKFYDEIKDDSNFVEISSKNIHSLLNYPDEIESFQDEKIQLFEKDLDSFKDRAIKKIKTLYRNVFHRFFSGHKEFSVTALLKNFRYNVQSQIERLEKVTNVIQIQDDKPHGYYQFWSTFQEFLNGIVLYVYLLPVFFLIFVINSLSLYVIAATTKIGASLLSPKFIVPALLSPQGTVQTFKYLINAFPLLMLYKIFTTDQTHVLYYLIILGIMFGIFYSIRDRLENFQNLFDRFSKISLIMVFVVTVFLIHNQAGLSEVFLMYILITLIYVLNISIDENLFDKLLISKTFRLKISCLLNGKLCDERAIEVIINSDDKQKDSIQQNELELFKKNLKKTNSSDIVFITSILTILLIMHFSYLLFSNISNLWHIFVQSIQNLNITPGEIFKNVVLKGLPSVLKSNTLVAELLLILTLPFYVMAKLVFYKNDEIDKFLSKANFVRVTVPSLLIVFIFWVWIADQFVKVRWMSLYRYPVFIYFLVLSAAWIIADFKFSRGFLKCCLNKILFLKRRKISQAIIEKVKPVVDDIHNERLRILNEVKIGVQEEKSQLYAVLKNIPEKREELEENMERSVNYGVLKTNIRDSAKRFAEHFDLKYRGDIESAKIKIKEKMPDLIISNWADKDGEDKEKAGKAESKEIESELKTISKLIKSELENHLKDKLENEVQELTVEFFLKDIPHNSSIIEYKKLERDAYPYWSLGSFDLVSSRAYVGIPPVIGEISYRLLRDKLVREIPSRFVIKDAGESETVIKEPIIYHSDRDTLTVIYYRYGNIKFDDLSSKDRWFKEFRKLFEQKNKKKSKKSTKKAR